MSDEKLLTAEILRGLLTKESLWSMRTEKCNLTGRFPDIPGLENFDRFTEEAAEMLGGLGPPPCSTRYDYPGLRELPLPVAARLRFVNSMTIELNGLESVSPETMRFLTDRSGTLILQGLKHLTLENAECIRDCGHLILVLHELRDFPGPVAQILAQKSCDLSLWLDGIERLSDETCGYLGQLRGWLRIPAVKELSDAAILAICKKKEGKVDLSGVTELSDVGAEALAAYGSEIILDGLEELPEAIAAIFGNRTGALSLKGLRSISPESAEALAGHGGLLNLDGIETLSPEAARALSRHQGCITLNGLKSISDDTAFELSKCDEMKLYLHGLTRIPKPFLECPASWIKNVVRIQSLQDVDENAAQKLIDSIPYLLNFASLKSISAPVARVIAKSPVNISFRNLESLTLEVAQILSGCERPLSLGGLESVTDEVEDALYEHHGRIELPDRKMLRPRIAAALAKRSDELHFESLETLTDEAAKELSSHRGDLYFGSLKSLSDNAAYALSQHRGKSICFFERLRISDQGMESLSNYSGELSLYDLVSFSETAQNSMSQLRGKIDQIPFPERLTSVPFVDRCLRDRWLFWIFTAAHGVETDMKIQSEMISDEIVKLLVDRLPPHGNKCLNLHVTELSEAAARLWAVYPTQSLRFERLESLTAESAASLANFAGDRLTFDMLDVESPDVLKALMTYRGNLELERFFELDAERSEILSTFEGTTLSLFNLWTMSDDAAQTISKSRIRQFSPLYRKELSAKAAGALARFEVELDALTRIRRRIARYR